MDKSKRHTIHSEQITVINSTAGHRRMRMIMIPIVLLLLPLLSAGFTYYYFGNDERELKRTISDLEREIEGLTNELEQAEQLYANARVESEVDKYAIEDLRQEIVGWSDKHSQQDEKLQFYQSLMDPDPTSRGLYIESLEINATAEEDFYNFSILLAQRSSNHRRLTGSVSIELLSEKNSDGIQTISLRELTEGEDRLLFGFKFFQQLDGSVKLPKDFIPGQIKLVVQIKGSSPRRIEEYLDWVVQS